uniref:Uncharacterized protein n=1 Tax=Parascaris equorum TaxID=6256 RepID=A0A914S1Y0_PAREQ
MFQAVWRCERCATRLTTWQPDWGNQERLLNEGTDYGLQMCFSKGGFEVRSSSTNSTSCRKSIMHEYHGYLAF